MSWIQGYDGKELYIKMCSFDWSIKDSIKDRLIITATATAILFYAKASKQKSHQKYL